MNVDPRPFINHMLLATEWCRITRRSTSEAAISKMMDRYTAEQLQAFLAELHQPSERVA